MKAEPKKVYVTACWHKDLGGFALCGAAFSSLKDAAGFFGDIGPWIFDVHGVTYCEYEGYKCTIVEMALDDVWLCFDADVLASMILRAGQQERREPDSADETPA